MAKLQIRFTRLSNTHHRFEAIRPDGGVETRELETRSFLLHDLVHYAIESEAGLRNSFYGQLARGASYDDVAGDAEGGKTELVVGALQTASKGEPDPVAFVVQLQAYWGNIGGQPPSWLTPTLIAAALERLRQVQGRWRATKFGEAMELDFEV
ncbi:MAG TPA: hypothetical protein VIA80_06800 [Hyphomonadaceae bacterium]|jgi:hypothetical protein